MINLENYKRTRKWNIDRGLTAKLDLNLENNMLEEEKGEFFEAYQQYQSLKDDALAIDQRLDLAVELIDAICDYSFVMVGFDTKTQEVQVQSPSDQITISAMKDAAEKMMAVMGALLMDVVGNKVDMNHCYNLVVTANELKPKKTDANGKNTKGDAWVDPKFKIREYLEELNVREYI